MAKFQGIKIRENATVYILEILSLADFRHLGLLCGAADDNRDGAATAPSSEMTFLGVVEFLENRQFVFCFSCHGQFIVISAMFIF